LLYGANAGFLPVPFEFDPAKSEANRRKHGIDFVQAQELWDDADALLFPARMVQEERWGLIGTLGGQLWVAIFTIRGEAIRLISVRRAREHEKDDYQKNLG
jgi:uncharacterized protein